MKSKYFSQKEFVCDGVNCFDKMSNNLLKMLYEAREVAGVPFVITSSWRSEEVNKMVGGKSNSAHLRGTAVDIACRNSAHRFEIVDALIVAGFTRIGIGNSFIHADCDEDLVNSVIWLY